MRISLLSRNKSEDSTQIVGLRLTSIQVTLIIEFRVCVSQLLHEFDLFRSALPSADGAALYVRQTVLDLVAKVIRRGSARHEPISMQTDQVESVIASVDSDEVSPFGELVFIVLLDVNKLLVDMLQIRRLSLISLVLQQLFVVLTVVGTDFLVKLVVELSLRLWIGWFFERAQANCASTLDGVVLLRQVLADLLVQVEQKATVVFVLSLLLRNCVELFVHLCDNFLELLLVEALSNNELESWRFKRIPVLKRDLQMGK